jgi:hypothetical protein
LLKFGIQFCIYLSPFITIFSGCRHKFKSISVLFPS